MGDVNLEKVGFNKLQLIELREKLISYKFATAPSKLYCDDRAGDALYSILINKLGLKHHASTYSRFKPNLKECISTVSVIINAMSHDLKDDWTIFDVNDNKTHPEEGSEVLCFVPSWGTYNVFHLVYEDNGKVTWRFDGEIIDEEKHFPLVWKNINSNHAKTKTDSEPAQT
jgi:hypothetical protein